MEKENFEKYVKAGKIASQVREFGAKLIKPGAKAIEVVDTIEKKIFELGAKPSFPVNFSINEIAAHWTPSFGDNTVLKDGDYVKLDIGTHIDGHIADTAVTVRVGMPKDNLMKCSEKMLSEALKIFNTGTTIGEIGAVIEAVSREFGFKPIRNLTGHSIELFNLHAGHVIPNIKNDNKYQIRDNEVYACEPFCTNGAGLVKDSGTSQIFRWIGDRPARTPESRRIMELSKTKFALLPFSRRWCQLEVKSSLKADIAIKQLVQSGALYEYFPLKEAGNGMVAQTEHTIIVGEKSTITTL